ncbi:antitermination protein Q [Klebsiella aerogenes]|uniref:antitermination protein Q n=1 Tax=Klebsiella aerogenes TaxID=548 RepID=UPI001BCEBC0A|nr:antitermination protein [Klebsiella aerogenes]
MRLKYAITIGDPKSAQIVAYQARSTGDSHLTRDDIVVSLGLTQSRCRAGLSLIYAKYTKDRHSAETALHELQQYAWTITDHYFPRYSGGGFRTAVSILTMIVLEEFCRTADTPGAKCLCGGKGEIRDLKKSRMKGFPVYKQCPRCHGTGLKPLTRTKCHHAILKYFPVSQSSFSRYWNPFYDALLAWCLKQESAAEDSYNFITNLKPVHQETSE